MPRYRLTVAYDGTAFHGWQKQEPPGGPPLRTVQGVVEAAARDVVREAVQVVGASRTDSGVHATGQVAAFTCAREIEPRRLRAALGSRLPDDVAIRRVAIVDERFDPIADAVEKGYRYRLAHGCRHGRPRPLFDRHVVSWTAYDLDPDRMDDAARRLVGEHDFASFARMHHGRESTVRTVTSCTVTASSRRRCAIDVAGSGFLYNMVRIVAGTLVEVGRGALEPADVERILATTDRRAAGPTLPPEGLCLRWIRYPSA